MKMNYFSKKGFSMAVSAAIAISLALCAGAAGHEIPLDKSDFTSGEIIVNGMLIDAPAPSVTEGVIMLPLRAIAEELGFAVSWRGDELRVGIGDNYAIWIGKALFSSDGGATAREFGPPPELIGNHTYVPLPMFNFGFEGFSAKIDDGKVIINSDGFTGVSGVNGAAGGMGGGAGFIFGERAHASHPNTVNEFVPVFAAELKRYNLAAPSLWPDNPVAGKSVILEDVDTGRFWSIGPEGGVAAYKKADIDAMGVTRRERPDDFSFFDGGAYITICGKSVADRIGSKQPHVGAYDSILWLTHEGFHKWEQSDRWAADPENIPNREREEFYADIASRVKRSLLQKQLMRAVAEPDNPALILDALATYGDYKEKSKNDYELSLYLDRIEGTAAYYELVSSLYIFYPDQIEDKDDLSRAISYLARLEDDYCAIGLVSEAYNIGRFAGALLDRVDESWKGRIAAEPLLTPLEMLARLYSDEALPVPRQPSREETEFVTEAIRDKIRFLTERQVTTLTALKQSISGMSEDERPVMETYLQYMMQNFEEMIKILPESEQKAQEGFIAAMRE
jgi:hypothetical protein